MGYKDKDGHICRYDVNKNDYVKANVKKGIITMFKPIDGVKYFYEKETKQSYE